MIDRKARLALAWAGLLGLTAVAAGAFGAHGVSDPRPKAWLQTGGEYGMIHALAAIAAVLISRQGGRLAAPAAWSFLAGGTLFSGSLYVMALSGALWLGAVTPIGGVLMMAGWVLLALAGFRLERQPSPD